MFIPFRVYGFGFRGYRVYRGLGRLGFRGIYGLSGFRGFSQEAANRGVTNGGVRPPGPNRPKWAQSVPNGPILNFPIFGPFSHKS